MLQALLISMGVKAIGEVVNHLVESDNNPLTDEQVEPIRKAVAQETGVETDVIRGAKAAVDVVEGVSTIIGIISELVKSDSNDLTESDVFPVLDAVDKENQAK